MGSVRAEVQCAQVGEKCRLRWQGLQQNFWLKVGLKLGSERRESQRNLCQREVIKGAGTQVGMNSEKPGFVLGTFTLHLSPARKVLPDAFS